MLDRNHSRTAEATAAIRACHLRYDSPLVFADPYAAQLTSPLWRAVAGNPLLYWPIVRGLLGALRPVHGWILVRDQMTVDELEAFVARGGRQYVLLGAGFDSIALRRPAWLADVNIIEIDHPATQAVKLARMAASGARLPLAHFEAVPVDFEREHLGDGLARSSFDANRPAFFAWQGVIYYLSSTAIADTLRHIAAASAPGSELVFDFLLPGFALQQGRGHVLSLTRAVTARMGERYISYHTPEDLERLLAAVGYELVDVQRDLDLEARYCADRRDGLSVMHGFGIARARKR
ncbi:MAG: class I SAM-dependent methyltransferase [Proteobacteria bacterium]|nr:class I SAM-dependent methyltransferase [Pseudomonadota bacterium]